MQQDTDPSIQRGLYRVTKTYGNERGFSCVFRQHLAKSHCRLLHGYSLGFRLHFECKREELTVEGWVIDFGSLSKVKTYLTGMYDHTVLISEDDPEKEKLLDLGRSSRWIAETRLVTRTGCEAFAEDLFNFVRKHVSKRIVSVECFEHASNSATYEAR